MAIAPLVAPALLLAPLAAARLAEASDDEADCVTVTVVWTSPPSPPEVEEGCRVMVMRTPEEAVSITVAVTGSREEDEEEDEVSVEEEEADARRVGGISSIQALESREVASWWTLTSSSSRRGR